MTIAFMLLLAMLEPGPDGAPWVCFQAIERDESTLTVSRHLTPEGQPAGDFVAWNADDARSQLGRVVWRLRDRPAWSLQIEAVTFVFDVPRRPTSPLRLRVEADGRVVARMPVSPQIQQIGYGRLGTYVLLARTADASFPPHGRIVEIGWPRRLSATLTERTGRILGTVSFALPDRRTLRAEAQEPWRLAREKAADFRRLCLDRRAPILVPPTVRPSSGG